MTFLSFSDAVPNDDDIRPWPWWVGLVACAAVALLAYLPAALRADFLNFDDNLYFGPDNPLFQAATARAQQDGVFAGLWWICDPRHVAADVYLPVAHASLWLDSWWFDGGALGPHVVAVLLHAIAGFLLLQWLLAMRQLPRAVAAGATALFLVHPALCESVAWVSSRKDVLCGAFVFASLWLTARAAWRPSAWALVAVAACGTLAMYSKATAVVQPLLALLVALYVGGDRRRFLWPLVLLLVTVPIAWHHHVLATVAGTMQPAAPGERLPQVPGAFLHYLRTVFWPRGLNVLYPEVKTLESFRHVVGPASAAIGGLVVAALVCWRSARWRAVGLGVLGFLLALLPFNTAYPASAVAVADRYLYLALPFVALAVAALAARIGRTTMVAVLLAVPLLFATWLRAPAFASSRALWQASLDVDGDNAVALLNLVQARSWAANDVAAVRPLVERAAEVARYPEHERRARLLLAQYALDENRCEDAVLQMEAAIAASERIAASGRVPVAAAQAQLAQTCLLAITPYRLASRPDDAARALQRAEQLAPDDATVAVAGALLAIDALAAELKQAGRAELAADDVRAAELDRRLEAARRQVPADAQIEYATGMLARLRGRRLEAIKHFRRAIEWRPDFAEAWMGAAEVCLEKNLCDEAEGYARSGIAAVTQSGRAADPRLRLLLVRALQGNGQIDAAIESLSVYVEQQPRDRQAARLYSGLLMHKARQRLSEPQVTHVELQRLVDRALAVNPQEPAVDLVRAHLLRDARRFADAIAALDRVHKALPDFDEIPAMLAENLRDIGYERLFRRDDDGAVDAWLRFLSLAPPLVSTEAVRLQLAAVWRRKEALGIAARAAGDRDGAERAFRACLRIDPEQHWAAWLLVAGLMEDPQADPTELDRLSAQALAWQQKHGIDRSRQVAVRADVLRRSARSGEARTLLDDYLLAPDRDAPVEVLERLRQVRREVGGQ